MRAYQRKRASNALASPFDPNYQAHSTFEQRRDSAFVEEDSPERVGLTFFGDVRSRASVDNGTYDREKAYAQFVRNVFVTRKLDNSSFYIENPQKVPILLESERQTRESAR